MKSQIHNTEYEYFLVYLKSMTESLKSFAEVSRKLTKDSKPKSNKGKSYLGEFQAQKRIIKIDL